MFDPSALKKHEHQDDVAIVGMACIFPKAPDLQTFWQNIVSKVDAISDPPDESLINRVYDPSSSATNRIYCKKGGYLKSLPPFYPSDFGVMPIAIEGAEPEHFIALKVAYDALVDAGLPDKPFNGERVEVLLGRGTFVNRGYVTAMYHSVVVDQTIRLLKELHPHYSEDVLLSLQAALMKQLPPFTPETAPGLCHNVMAGLIANRLNLQGRNLVLDAACASGLLALEIGMDDLLMGKCDAALVGGVQISTLAPIHMIFTQLGALSHQPHLKPFDKQADGTMLGEGIGMLVLKRLQDAIQDDHRIYAVVKGVGSSSDGRARGLLAPRLEGEVLAVRRAYQRAGFDPDTIEMIEAHGTGIPLGDVTEIRALTEVFGRRNGTLPRCAIGTVKSMIGHLIPAAGIAGIIKTALSVYHNVHPPTLWCDEPNPDLELDKTPFFINTETRPWIHGNPSYPRRAAVSSFGFGGINAHAIIEEHVATEPETHKHLNKLWDSELFVIEGENRQELVQQCHTLQNLVQGLLEKGHAGLADLAYTVNTSLTGKDQQLTIVADTFEDLQRKLHLAASRLEDVKRHQIKDRSGMFFFENPLAKEGGKLAFLFPGEGSQYVNMLADLCLHFPEARSCFDLLDQAYADHPRNYLPSQIIFPPNTQARADAETKIWEMDGAVDAVSTANRALFKIMSSLGIVPDAILGHSSGELVALEASGGVILEEEQDVIGHIRTGNRIIEALASEDSIPAGQLLTVGGVNYEKANLIVQESTDFLCIAMDNCPHQFVLCGTGSAIQQAAASLKKVGGICQLLPFSRAYHTERFEPVLKLLTDFFDNGRFDEPAIPLYSCMTAGLYPSKPDDVKKYAIKQWARPVRFRETIEKMYADGVRIFLEVGPRANLTGFVKDILGKRPALAIPSNVHHRSGITQLNHALGFLIAHGIQVNLENLYSNRSVINLKEAEEKQNKPAKQGLNISLAMPLLSLKDHTIELPDQPASHLDTQSAHTHDAITHVPEVSAVGAGMQEYFRTMENFLNLQEQVMASYFGNAGAGIATSGEKASLQDSHLQVISGPPSSHGTNQLVDNVSQKTSPVPEPGYDADTDEKTVVRSTDGHSPIFSAEAIKKMLLDLVSDKTGYPPDMLALDQNLEADLGIDSIKRVEILGAITKQIGALDESQTEVLNRLTTLGEIIQFLNDWHAVQAQKNPDSAAVDSSENVPVKTKTSEETIRKALVALVSEKTGYPDDMIALDQNLEADLGIDSIKRVEILGAFAKQFGALSDAEAEGLNRLSTLQDIIAYLTVHLAGNASENVEPAKTHADLHIAASNDDAASSLAKNILPFSGTIIHEIPGKEITIRCTVDLSNEQFLTHHTMGGPVSQENDALLALPVMPFNMTLEIMAEGASRMYPGKVLVGMENIQALNWIMFEKEQVTLDIMAKTGPESLKVAVTLLLQNEEKQNEPKVAAKGIFLFSQTFPDGPAPKKLKIKNPSTFSIAPEQFYPKALFHGPAFQTVDSVSTCGDNGIEVLLKRPASIGLFKNSADPDFLADPVLLDGAGQAVGLWAAHNLSVNYVIFPVGLKSARFYRNPATSPSMAKCRIQCSCSPEIIESTIDLIGDDEMLYARLEGLQHTRLDMPEIMHHFRGSRNIMLSSTWTIPLESFPDSDKMVCCKIDSADYNFNTPDGIVMLSVIAHIVLTEKERKQWLDLRAPEKRKTEWLLGRLVAKEAVRRLLQKMVGMDVWSADIEITPDENGKPLVAGNWIDKNDWIPTISLSHANGTIIAIAAPGDETLNIGIDLEPIRSLDTDFQHLAFSPEELNMLSQINNINHDEWLVRLWCSKEATSKAIGHGMPGGPRDIQAIKLQPHSGVVHLRTANSLQQELPELSKKELVSYTLRENNNIIALSIYNH